MNKPVTDGEIIYTDRTGATRVRVVREESPAAPFYEHDMPILRIDDPPFVRATVIQVQGAIDYGFDLMRVWRHFAARWNTRPALEVFERYLRAFHGTSTTHSYNVGVVGEYWYFIFDTAAWRSVVGIEEGQESAVDSFDQYRAYLSGEVYRLVLEHKLRSVISTTDLADPQAPAVVTVEEAWRAVDSSPLLYGWDPEHVTDTALAAFGIPEILTTTV